MPQLETIRFRSNHPELFAGETGIVDELNFTIKGVSCITSECEAEGHSLFVDNTTLTQLHKLSKEMVQVPVTINHDGGVDDIDGWLQNFRIDGNQLRADWVLLESHPKTITMMERAKKQPKTFGLSYAFRGDPKGVTFNGRQCARAEAVMSCDVVKRAAANKGGLFSAKDSPTDADLKRAIIQLAVDTRKNLVTRKLLQFQNMPDINPPAEPTMADLMKAVQGLTTRLEGFEQTQGQIVEHLNGQGQQSQEDTFKMLSDFNAMDDAALAAYNQANGTSITREDISAAVSDYNARLGGEEGEQGQEDQEAEGQTRTEGAAAGAGEGAAVGAGAAGSAAFSALQRQVIALSQEIKAEKKSKQIAAENIEFEAVNEKVTLLHTQRNEAIELAERLVAENEALRLHVRTGTRPVKAGVDNGERLFSANSNGELHAFQVRVKAIEAEKKCTPGEAIMFAIKEPNGAALHADWLQSGSPTIHA